ncbi:hypothetical protein QE152_g4795 [Popillia japonica]|uniref:Uncharacterized protein n=1 Tax=Popillia japonica TaxID=7064 RepID=A0AAW1MZP4_POPJA
MGDTAELKSRKKVIKGQLTRFNTFISDAKNKSKLSEIETRLERINLLFSEFDDVQFKLELANEERIEVEDSFCPAIAQAKELLRGDYPILSQNTIKVDNQADNVRYPIINLPIFDGWKHRELAAQDDEMEFHTVASTPPRVEDYVLVREGSSHRTDFYSIGEVVSNMKISFVKLGHEECWLCEWFDLHSKATSHKKELPEDNCDECSKFAASNKIYFRSKTVPRRFVPENNRWASGGISRPTKEELASESLTLKYAEPGHTFMAADSFHHQVERSLKKMRKIYDFEDFTEAVKHATINTKVLSMDIHNFFNWENGTSQY